MWNRACMEVRGQHCVLGFPSILLWIWKGRKQLSGFCRVCLDLPDEPCLQPNCDLANEVDDHPPQ